MAELAGWHELFLMLGGAAAALVGLLFVAASLHLDFLAGPRAAALRALALHALLGYLALLLLAVILLIPDQSARRVGAELVLLGGTCLGWLPLFIARVAGRGARWGPARRAWLRTFLAWGLDGAGLVAIGIGTAAGDAGAIAWLPLVAVALLLGAVLTSWDLLLRIPPHGASEAPGP